MTKKAKANVNKIGYTGVKPKTLAACVMATASLVAMMGVLPMSKQNVDAQMMMGHGSGNMTTGLQELQHNVMANGTINLEQTILEAIGSKVNTSLTQAITTAERTVGDDSFAVAAFGGEYGGYFSYQIIVGTPRMEEFYTVLVDPGNGQILATQKVSAAELNKMHQEHSADVAQNGSGDGGGIGFPFLIPH